MALRPETVEERVGSLILEGQRHEVWVRSETDAAGNWHNALVFRRDGIHSTLEAQLAGLDWHLPPGNALQRALQMSEAERLELFQRALRPRPPLI